MNFADHMAMHSDAKRFSDYDSAYSYFIESELKHENEQIIFDYCDDIENVERIAVKRMK